MKNKKTAWHRLVKCTRCSSHKEATNYQLRCLAGGVRCEKCGGNMVRAYSPKVQPYGKPAEKPKKPKYNKRKRKRKPGSQPRVHKPAEPLVFDADGYKIH